MSAQPFKGVGGRDDDGDGDDNVREIKRGRPNRQGAPSQRINIETWDGYDAYALYPRGSDYQGHSVNVQVNLPKDMQGIVGKIVQDCPDFKLSGDVIRTAVVHYLHWWYVNRAEEKTAVLIKDSLIYEGMAQRREKRKQDRERVKDTGESCGMLAADRDWEGLALEVRMLRGLAKILPGTLKEEAEMTVRRYEVLVPQEVWDAI